MKKENTDKIISPFEKPFETDTTLDEAISQVVEANAVVVEDISIGFVCAHCISIILKTAGFRKTAPAV